MARRASWKELIIGLLAFAGIVIVSVVVLVFARIGTMHGDTFRLYAQTGEARGLIRGSEVWLAGQKVGIVKDVSFMPARTADPAHRLLIAMDVLSSTRESIRLNSTAQVRSGGTLISSPVVYLTIGTTAARAVHPEDTITAIPQSDLETVSSEFAVASREFPAIIANIKLLNQQLHSVQGTLGAFGIDRGGVEMTRVQSQLGRLASRVEEPRGTIGLAMSSGSPLAERAHRVIARADSVRALLTSDRSAYGRFQRDSTLIREIADIRNELDILKARMASTSGTLGRARSDSALLQAVAGTQREMTLIMADMRRRPLRYVHF
jgi:phospholipid/cholesterol/gamma-HCH transport system substrate-binding protein